MKKILFAVVLLTMSFTAAHKFYLSVTNITYSEKDDALQITVRIFVDDLEDVLYERYGLEAYQSTGAETKPLDAYIERYLRKKLAIQLDGQTMTYSFLGKAYEEDVVLCYLELTDVGMEQLSTMEIRNELLTDLYDEQKNLVHVKWKGKKRSFIMIKSNAKGMLNL
ncbi:MAG: DUF6702 family protein [Bacteroidota bacterium]